MKKHILITGSTDGIGKLAAIRLAKAGHSVNIHGRNAEKVNRVIDEIKTLTNNENITGFVADFSDLEAVKTMAQQVQKEMPKIDVLINNAGIYKSVETFNKDGFDIRIAVNYFAPYLLTNSLLQNLNQSSAPRLINVSSAAQRSVSNEALIGEVQFSEQEAYAQSKLALLMWSFHLASTESKIGVIALNPGSLLNTNMVKEAFGHHWSPAEKGGNILYDLTVDEEYNGATGKYFDNDKGDIKGMFGPAHEDAYDADKIAALIKESNRILFS